MVIIICFYKSSNTKKLKYIKSMTIKDTHVLRFITIQLSKSRRPCKSPYGLLMCVLSFQLLLPMWIATNILSSIQTFGQLIQIWPHIAQQIIILHFWIKWMGQDIKVHGTLPIYLKRKSFINNVLFGPSYLNLRLISNNILFMFFNTSSLFGLWMPYMCHITLFIAPNKHKF